jgi:alcohol dehydrogenase
MVEFRLPRLREGEVLVEVTFCTLCGSDLHTFRGHRATPCPTVLGHEIIGRVAAFGEGARPRDHFGATLELGQRVTWSVAASCGTCFFCRDGLPQKCERLFKYGHEAIRDDAPFCGGLAEVCHLVRGTAIMPIPEGLPDAVAGPANCATATVAASLRVAPSLSGSTVVILGAGMLGVTACAMARTEGAANVVLVDVAAARLEIGKRFGASHTVLTGGETDELSTLLQTLTEGRGADVALEMSGAREAIDRSTSLLRIGGTAVWVGAVFPEPPVKLAPEVIVKRLLSLRGVHNYTPADLATALDFLARHHTEYPFAELVGEQFPLSQVQRAFDLAQQGGYLRVAVVPDRAEFPS